MALNSVVDFTKKGALHRFVENGGEEDLSILKDSPCRVRIGHKRITVRSLTIDNHKRWLRIFGTILRQYEVMLAAVEWPTEKSEIMTFRQKFQLFFSTKNTTDQIVKMIEETLFREPGNHWWRRHKRWFRKNVTVMQLMDLFFYLYLWNCEAPKKNATFLLARMGFAKAKGILYGGWSRNLAGLSGAQVTQQWNVPPPGSLTNLGKGQSGKRPSGSPNSSGSARPRVPTLISKAALRKDLPKKPRGR